MPWFPDFIAAAELARREIRAEGRADPVAQYLAALGTGAAQTLEKAWPGQIVVQDPRAGEVRGHRQLRRFVKQSHELLAARDTRTELVGSTCGNGRAVVELVARLIDGEREVRWPVAVVAESTDELSVEFRTYCSQVPVDGRRHVRPPILAPGDAHPGDVVGRYQAALDAGDVDAIVRTFATTGYLVEAIGPHARHRGPAELRACFSEWFGAGGGIGLEPCAVTDDGVRCALEYTCTRWGSHVLSPQAGLAVFERDADGLLAAVRLYDDIAAPASLPDGPR